MLWRGIKKESFYKTGCFGKFRNFYPKEYLLGSEVLSYLNQELNVNLPEEEAGNIAFHIVNAQIDATENKIGMQNGMLMVKMLKDLFQIVQLYYQWEIDEESINYSRFVIHMQFFFCNGFWKIRC